MASRDELFPLLINLDDSFIPNQSLTLFDLATSCKESSIPHYEQICRMIEDKAYLLGFKRKHLEDNSVDLLEMSGEKIFNKVLRGMMIKKAPLLKFKDVRP